MDIAIASVNVTHVVADLLVLKHADGFYGADAVVAQAVGFDGHLRKGEVRFCSGGGLAAREVVFIGVGQLGDFRYERIQEFGSEAIKLARQRQPVVRHIALTIHGPGYGLDPEESFLSMIAGIVTEWQRSAGSIAKVTIAERSDKRCRLLANLLQSNLDRFSLVKGKQHATVGVEQPGPQSALPSVLETNILRFGARAEDKPRLFVAMPFAEEFIDEFEIAFREAAKASEYICERLDLESFTGDIVSEIKKRILGSHGVIALLNSHNPNVFLEIGFALAHNKPIILVAKDDTKLPFDVSSHRCLRYRNISQLRQALSGEIASLKAQGVLAKSA